MTPTINTHLMFDLIEVSVLLLLRTSDKEKRGLIVHINAASTNNN